MSDFITAIGPYSDTLPNNTLEGTQPVSRNGEVTQNAFIDAREFNVICTEPNAPGNLDPNNQPYGAEPLPRFDEWASVQPGYICLYSRNKTQVYQKYLAVETACPVIACAQRRYARHNASYGFAGIARTKSIRDRDDIEHGAKTDEFFTLHIGGPCTLLNNGNQNIKNGDMVEWTFHDNTLPTSRKRARCGIRRVQVRKAVGSHERVLGKALSFAKPGEAVDILVGSASM